MVEGGEGEGEGPSSQERPPSYRAEGNTANPRQVDIRDEGRESTEAIVGGNPHLPSFLHPRIKQKMIRVQQAGPGKEPKLGVKCGV